MLKGRNKMIIRNRLSPKVKQAPYQKMLLMIISICCFWMPVVAQQASPSYNYAAISAHPRLLLKKDGEAAIKRALKDNPELQVIDDYIMKTSDGLLTEQPLIFKKEGKRLLAVSRAALTRLFYLSYSYRMTGNAKYLDRAETELNALCSFESWNPSHFLDVGEMTMALAIGYDWLYDHLKESTKENVRKAILEKAFAPSYDNKDAWFLTAHNNWNSVCNAGLVFGALAIMDEEKQSSIAIIERSLKSNVLPLHAYAPDGNYPEGPGYWNYGTTFQVLLCAALESALGSDHGLSKAPGFMESAYYMLFAEGPSRFYFNYYDGGRSPGAAPAMFWFANKLKDPSLIAHERSLIKSGGYTRRGTDNDDRILPMALIFAGTMPHDSFKAPEKKIFNGRGITPVTIVRTSWKDGEGLYLGIKGGSASDSHAHMDQGTFVYDIGALRWAMDFGLQSYITLESKGVDLWNMAQNSQRWDVFRYNNLNHNTLTINNQRHNVQGRAEITATFEKGSEQGAKIDLTPVLNPDHELKSATRKAVIVDASYLRIEDQLQTGNRPVDLRWNMVTPATAKLTGPNTIRLSQKGKSVLLEFSSDVPLKLAIRPSENPAQYKCEFGNYNYGAYNQPNKGTLMVGFDSKLPANKTVRFTITLKEDEGNK